MSSKHFRGAAQGVAEMIDSMHHPAVLGTLAGDNTIFVTPASVAKIDDTLKLVKSLLTDKKLEVA